MKLDYNMELLDSVFEGVNHVDSGQVRTSDTKIFSFVSRGKYSARTLVLFSD